MQSQTRRAFLASVSGITAAGLAGCLGSGTTAQDSTTATATASFFVFGDVARHVAGDAASAETLVPTGQHGHGWEPDPDIQGRVLESDLFVHGPTTFQPWADDILTALDADDSAVTTVDIAANVDLHEFDDDEHDHDSHSDHEADARHNENDTHHNDSDVHHNENDTHHDDHDEGDAHHDDHSHNHGPVDPHFWMDPHRVETATETLRDAFQSVDDANADAYAENAESYRKSLSDLHAAYESGLETRERDVILVAGHNAFGYLSDRYGFDIVALTGLSPDEEPSPRDIERAQEAIAEHGIRHVLSDPLTSDRAANQLVAETDAEDVLPFTPIPGLTQEWADENWGYIDIMRNVNLPSLRTALDAR
ncbi:metal ABC transporter substrate-binding protein [Haloferax mucosum]|nr:zinc ABC transporter substrate-binding protein [Haloferax mucosum]